MGDLKDTIDVISSITRGDGITKQRILNAKPTSLARMASEGTLQFPVLVSASLDIDTSQNISKALERNYTTFVQTALSLFPTMRTDTPGGVNASNFIKQFHQNSNTSDYDTFDLVANLVEGYTKLYSDDNFVIESAIYNGGSKTSIAKNKEQLIDLLESVRTDILNNKYVPKTEITYNFNDSKLNEKFNSLYESDDNNDHFNRNYNYRKDTDNKNYDYRRANDSKNYNYKKRIDSKQFNYKLNQDNRNYNYRKDTDNKNYDYRKDTDNKNYNYRKDQDNKNYDYRKDQDNKNYDYRKDQDNKNYDYRKDQDAQKANFDKDKFYYQQKKDMIDRHSVELLKNVLVDNDVKKANELIATTLHITVRLLDSEGSDQGIVDFIIGVKCIMHLVRSEDMISNLVGACTNNDKIFNFFRWTTGEISFFKDFLFNIKEIKEDVGNQRKGASRWWLSLKKRRLLAKSKQSVLSKNRLLPNATIVINAEEAAYIKTQYGYDLFNPLFINKIIDQYYLLGFVIVDNAAQVAHFMFENDRTNYQVITFSALEKANVNDERKFKEMLKAVNRF